MATLTEIRSSLRTRLLEINNLEVHEVHPDRIDPPCAVVGSPDEVTYNTTFGPTKVRYAIPIRLYVARVDAEEAQWALDPYIAPTGATSIKTAVENKAVTVSAGWDFVSVLGADEYGSYRVGDAEYVGVEFTVEVISA